MAAERGENQQVHNVPVVANGENGPAFPPMHIEPVHVPSNNQPLANNVAQPLVPGFRQIIGDNIDPALFLNPQQAHQVIRNGDRNNAREDVLDHEWVGPAKELQYIVVLNGTTNMRGTAEELEEELDGLLPVLKLYWEPARSTPSHNSAAKANIRTYLINHRCGGDFKKLLWPSLIVMEQDLLKWHEQQGTLNDAGRIFPRGRGNVAIRRGHQQMRARILAQRATRSRRHRH